MKRALADTLCHLVYQPLRTRSPLTGSGTGRACSGGLGVAPVSATNSSKAGTPPGNPCVSAGQAGAPLAPNMLLCSDQRASCSAVTSAASLDAWQETSCPQSGCVQRSAPVYCAGIGSSTPAHKHRQAGASQSPGVALHGAMQPLLDRPQQCLWLGLRPSSSPTRGSRCPRIVAVSAHMSNPCPSVCCPAWHKPSSLGTCSTI